MKTLFVLALVVIAFLAGVISADIISIATTEDSGFSEKEMASVIKNSNIYSLITGNPIERSSPKDRIKERDINLYEEVVVFKVKDPILASFSNTNSMDPLIDENSNAIEIVPEREEDIQVGDIISFEYQDQIIIHRVVEKGIDDEGSFFLTKGDNNPNIDPLKVRFHQIKRVLVAIIY